MNFESKLFMSTICLQSDIFEINIKYLFFAIRVLFSDFSQFFSNYCTLLELLLDG